MRNQRDGLGFVLGLMVGALAGAAVAITYAPQSGRKTRAIIKSRAGEYKQRAAELAAEYRDKMANLTQEFREEASGYIERGKEMCRGSKAEENEEVPQAEEPVVPDSLSEEENN